MKDYTIQEGRFPLPGEGWTDASMTILRNPNTLASLVITRGLVAQGRTPEEELEHQWALLETSVQALTSEPRRRVVLSQAEHLPAYETCSQFMRSGYTHHQIQLAVAIEREKKLLIFTWTSMQPITEAEQHYWQQLKDGLVLA